ncbi:MAG: VWA domain-containing protein [Litorilituus sp.]|jgi:Ca-activated chloride channel family protein|nr:VWA domain-containing protein [Litorilituus sp.]
MIHFAWPWLLLLLPLPLLVYWLPKKNTRQTTAALVVPHIQVNNQVKAQYQQRKKTPLIIMSLCWLLTVLALSQPQWLGDAIDIPTQAREMMIAVDLSGSMQIEDMSLRGSAVNRLAMLKVVLGNFIERRVGDRLGLILFADDAYMQTPMTFDRQTVKQMLNESVLGLVGRKTAIGDAIALAVKRFDAKEQSNKVLLLLTDGQNTAGKISPEQALELAVAKNITIYSIGIGADVMIQQSLFGSRRVNPSSELDEETLTKLAEQTGGQYFRARNSQGMEQIYQLLDQLEPLEQEQQQMRPLTALFYWPLSLGLLLVFGYLCAVNISSIYRKTT